MPEEQVPETAEPREINDRLVVVETVYHQPFGEEAVAVDSRFSRELKTKAQLYPRRCRVGEDWEPLDYGWVERAGMLVISNTEGRFLQAVPTDAEKAAVAERVLEVCFAPEGLTQHDGPLEAHWLVPPGESMRAVPAAVKSLRLRCRKGECRFTVHVFPD